jgi:SAM-dependent methyltransferase
MLSQYVEILNLFGDENRLRLCALLSNRELRVTDLVKVTGISQSRVSTHLGRLREAGYVLDRRDGPQAFYRLSSDRLPTPARAFLEDAASSSDPTLESDRKRLTELEAERRGHADDSLDIDLSRDYSPGRTWQSLALGLAPLLRPGDVLDVGCGDGSAAACVAPYCKTFTGIDNNERVVQLAQRRLARFQHARVQHADAEDMPFSEASFDTILLFHTLTYARDPARTVKECARVLRSGGRLVVLCLDRHRQHRITEHYGERHPGFSPKRVRGLLSAAGLDVASAEVACRESKKPHLQVVLGVADKPEPTRNQNGKKR